MSHSLCRNTRRLTCIILITPFPRPKPPSSFHFGLSKHPSLRSMIYWQLCIITTTRSSDPRLTTMTVRTSSHSTSKLKVQKQKKYSKFTNPYAHNPNPIIPSHPMQMLGWLCIHAREKKMLNAGEKPHKGKHTKRTRKNAITPHTCRPLNHIHS